MTERYSQCIQLRDVFRTEHRGRGVAIGDLDNDGRLDLIISHVNEPVAVLRNQADTGNHWLGIELVGRDHRDIVGARIVVEVGGQRLTRFAKGGGSYLSSGDRRIFVGLGKTERLERITVHWPPHKGAPLHEEAWSGDQLRIDVHWRLQEGTPPQAPQRSK